jgi:hypothetical protein
MNAKLSHDHSAEERLSRTRQALFQHVNRNASHAERLDPSRPAANGPLAAHYTEPSGSAASFEDDPTDHSGWAMAKRAGKAWWRHHPARAAISMAQPVLGAYGERHPWKLLGSAAGVGALLVVTKPWKLISMTGLAMATLRSSQLSAVMASLVSPQDPQED